MVYKLTFSFRASDGQSVEVVEKTHEIHLLQDDREEELLYLEDHPQRATMLDALPSSPKIDENDRIIPASVVQAALACFLPFLVLGGHGFWFVAGQF